MIYAYDVFDTTLVRTVVTPAGIYELMKIAFPFRYDDSELPFEFRRDFVKIRLEADAAAPRIRNSASVYDIYGYIRDKYNISNDVIKSLVAFEIETLINNIAGVPEILSQIEINRLSPYNSISPNVIFVTDTHYRRDIIQQLLKAIGVYREGDKVYASCTEKYTKSSGDLFKKIMIDYNITAKELWLVDDNYEMSIKPAQKLGVVTNHFTLSKLNDYEKAIAGRHEKEITLQSSLTTGIARITRLNNNNNDFLYRVGASVAGPQLVPYVAWLLKKAKDDELKRLYFLSRDGQILMQIAKILGTDIELKYLYASRAAWYPALSNGDTRELLLEYLKQEGVFEYDKIGLVDTGFTGSLPAALNFASRGKIPIISYFYTIVKPCNEPYNIIKGFFYDANYRTYMPFEYYAVTNLLEMFCAGDHGVVMGYDSTNNGVKPVLNGDVNPNVEDWGLNNLRNGILAYAEMYKKYNLDKICLDVDIYRDSMLRLFNRLTRHPTRQEADMLGMFLFANDMYDKEMKPFAPSLKLMDVFKINEATRWIEASVKRSSGIGKLLFYPELTKRLIKDKILR